MRESIDRYFQLGLIASMAYPDYATDPVGVVRKIARDSYFQVIELNPLPAKERQEASAILAASHMVVSCGSHGRLLSTGLNPNDLDEAGRLAAERVLLEGVDEAAELGAECMAFLSGKWTPETREEALGQLLKTTVAVCDYAAKKGIRVELEVFDFDIAKASLIGSAALAARFAALVRERCSNFGLMVDLSHIPMCYEEGAYVLRVLQPWITHFHVGNTVICDPLAEAYGDEHPRFGFPRSEHDTPELLAFLRAMQAEGFFRKDAPMLLSFEVKPRPYEDPEVVVASTKRVLNRAWALL